VAGGTAELDPAKAGLLNVCQRPDRSARQRASCGSLAGRTGSQTAQTNDPPSECQKGFHDPLNARPSLMDQVQSESTRRLLETNRRQRLGHSPRQILKDPLRLILVVLAIGTFAANALWWWVNRHGGAHDIDEAGYLTMSINDYQAWHSGGLSGLVHTIDNQPNAPLVPFASFLIYLIAGRPSIFGAFFVQFAALSAVMLLSYALASRLAGRLAGLLAAIAAGSTPILLDYAHEYSFALPAAACFTTAVWAATRSHQMTSLRWATLWGAALATTLLSRTMTVAFIPGFALLSLVHVAVSGNKRRSVVGVLCGTAAGVVVAGPWYVAQGANIWQYLTSYGYGAQSLSAGSNSGTLSGGAWVTFFQENINRYIGLPLTLVLVFGALALAAKWVAAFRGDQRFAWVRLLSSSWFYLAVLVAEGLLALESSRNTGTGFLAPLVPSMFVLAVSAVFTIAAPRLAGIAVTAIGILCLSLPSYIAKMALSGPAHQPVTLLMPGLGQVVVIDGRDFYDTYVADGGEGDVSDPSGRKWAVANNRLANVVDSFVARHRGSGSVAFAFDQGLLNTNTFLLAEMSLHGTSPAVGQLSPSTPESSESYSAEITSFFGSGPGLLLVLSSPVALIPPVLNQTLVEQAARQLGFLPSTTIPLPDHSTLGMLTR
jgi:hypothetical protein